MPEATSARSLEKIAKAGRAALIAAAVCWIVFRLCLVILPTIAKLLPPLEPPTFGNDAIPVGMTQCEPIQGNQDMYSIGIRIVTYLQCLLTAITRYWRREHAVVLIPVNLWFLSAFCIVLFTMLMDTETSKTEYSIIFWLGNGVSAIVLGSFPLIPQGYIRETTLTRIAELITWGLWKAVSILYVWSILPQGADDMTTCVFYEWKGIGIKTRGGIGPSTYTERVFNVVTWAIWASWVARTSFVGITISRSILVQNLENVVEKDGSLQSRGDTDGLIARTLMRSTSGSSLTGNLSKVNSTHSPDVAVIPSKWRVFLDHLVIFSMGDLDWLVFGVGQLQLKWCSYLTAIQEPERISRLKRIREIPNRTLVRDSVAVL